MIAPDQMFIPAQTLKADLSDLLKKRANEETSKTAENSRRSFPPANESSVTYQAWKKTMKPGFEQVSDEVNSHLTPEISAKLLKNYQQLMKNRPPSQAPTISMDDCEFMIMEHTVRLEGPCICGSVKMFKDCCGEKLAASKQNPKKK